jgi:hypothetical protein
LSTSGSVFDGVKLNTTTSSSGGTGTNTEQAAGQQQLLRQVQTAASNMYRTPIAVLHIGDKDREYLAVGHDRCKLDIVQSTSLLKQMSTTSSVQRRIQMPVNADCILMI